MSTTKSDDSGNDAGIYARARRKVANIADSTAEPESNDAWFKPTVIALSAVIAISLLFTLYFVLTDKG